MAAGDVTRRKSAAERREEIVHIAIEHFAARRLQRHVDRGHRARRRHLPALPLPALPHEARPLPRLPRRDARAHPATLRGRRARRAAGGGAQDDGRAPTSTCCRTATRCSSRCRATRRAPTRRSRPPCASATATLVKLVTRLSGAEPYRVWEFFAHGMLLNVVASLDLDAIADREPGRPLGRPGRADPARAGDGARRLSPFFRFATE